MMDWVISDLCHHTLWDFYFGKVATTWRIETPHSLVV